MVGEGAWKVPFSGGFKEKERQLCVWILPSEDGLSLAHDSGGVAAMGPWASLLLSLSTPPPPMTPASQFLATFKGDNAWKHLWAGPLTPRARPMLADCLGFLPALPPCWGAAREGRPGHPGSQMGEEDHGRLTCPTNDTMSSRRH